MSAAKAGTPTTAAPVAMIYDPDKKVSVVVYNMERFAQDCVNVFCELSGYAKNKVGSAPTPFLDESNDPLAIIEVEPTKARKGVPATKVVTPILVPRTCLQRKLGPLPLVLVR